MAYWRSRNRKQEPAVTDEQWLAFGQFPKDLEPDWLN